MLFVVTWFVAFVSLMLTLGLLSRIYDACGGDLGLTGWRRETIIGVMISLLQAAAFWVGAAVLGVGAGRMFPFAAIVLILAYKITHISGSSLDGTYAMDNGAIIAIAAAQFGILFGAGVLFDLLLGTG